MSEDRKRDHISDIAEKLRTALAESVRGGIESKSADAAVSVILRSTKDKRDLDLLLVKRKSREGDPWSGHMAFPGGRKKDDDLDLLQTAIRETKEEVGVDLKRCILLGGLNNVVSTTLSIVVKPFVFLEERPAVIELNSEEIASSFWVPISFFLDRDNLSEHTIVRFGSQVRVPSYSFEGKAIWGLTLRVINDFLSLYNS